MASLLELLSTETRSEERSGSSVRKQPPTGAVKAARPNHTTDRPDPFMFRRRFLLSALCAAAATVFSARASAREEPFKHPGGLHTQADLDRMKAKVAARETPWIEGWEALIKDRFARADYRPSPRPNMGSNRQAASRDAHAAYLNFLRWYVSGDKAHAAAAIRICNEWSAAVNQVCSGNNIPGLSGIYAAEFAMVGELLRICPDWQPADQERFKRMLRDYAYPAVSRFLQDRNQRGDSHFWANWDICNVSALIAMGVFLDDRAIFDEGVEYFKNGKGTGAIMNAVPFVHPGNLGQWQESGRDQPHAHLGIGLMGQGATVAWNQGVDLFGYADSRLLAAAEYAAREALSQPVPYTPYDNSSGAKNHWLANHTRGRFSTPVWELLYNHYVVRQGRSAPAVKRVAELSRPELSGWDHFGYGTLTFTLDGKASPYPPLPAPSAPAGLVAKSGLGRVYLNWKLSAKLDVARYIVRRSRVGGGDFETIADRSKYSTPSYVDRKVEAGATYRYIVIAANQSGEGPASEAVTVTVGEAAPLPGKWKTARVGRDANGEGLAPEASYSSEGGRTLRLRGTGRDIGGKADDAGFVYLETSGDFTLTARVVGPDPWEIGGSPLSKFGLMARESLAPDSKMVALTLGESGTRGTRARFRAATGGAASTRSGNNYSWSPIWYRLTRKGPSFIAEHRVDDSGWFEVGKADIDLPGEILLGFTLATRKPEVPGEVLFECITLDR
jgi:hypothetical protein